MRTTNEIVSTTIRSDSAINPSTEPASRKFTELQQCYTIPSSASSKTSTIDDLHRRRFYRCHSSTKKPERINLVDLERRLYKRTPCCPFIQSLRITPLAQLDGTPSYCVSSDRVISRCRFCLHRSGSHRSKMVSGRRC